jgi:uncharacterized protein (DUF1697 family)
VAHVALLRGINVGGKNKLPMKDLVAMFERAGCARVRHYIQSGNVVFDADEKVAKKLAGAIEAEIQRALGLRVPVILRTARELRAVAAKNPLLEAGASEGSLHVMFLASDPGKSRAAALDPDRSPPDTFVVRGREVYLCCPTGVGRTKLSNAWFDAQLGTVSTGRNWKTVLRLVEMCGDRPA